MHEVEYCLVTSHLLIVQSKRLSLNSAQKRLAYSPDDEWKLRRVARFESDVAKAETRYQSIVLRYGRPETTHDYWMVAYSKLIATGSKLREKMNAMTSALPTVERLEVASDIGQLQLLVERWSNSRREAMT